MYEYFKKGPVITIQPPDSPEPTNKHDNLSLPYKCERKPNKKPVCKRTHKDDRSEGVYTSRDECENVCKPQTVLPGQVNLCRDQTKDDKMSCCEIVAIVAGSLVLLLLLVSLVSNVSGGAKKSRRTARRTARKGTKRK
jgi:hypothetical protein